MKYTTLLAFLFLASCDTKESVNSEISILKSERSSLETEIQSLEAQRDAKNAAIKSLDEKLKVLNIYDSGKRPKYVLKLKLKQSRFSLDIGEHVKDSMNAIEFDLPVDKDLYDSVSIGSNIVDDFRVGSFIMNGSFGDWKMTVIDKSIQ